MYDNVGDYPQCNQYEVWRIMMKTVQITIDEALLARVDNAVSESGANRSAFIREALEIALRQRELKMMEQRHRAGYERHPLTAAEFDIWQSEQVWEANA